MGFMREQKVNRHSTKGVRNEGKDYTEMRKDKRRCLSKNGASKKKKRSD